MSRCFEKVNTGFGSFRTTPAFLALTNSSGQQLSAHEIAKAYPLNLDDLMASTGKLQNVYASMFQAVRFHDFQRTLSTPLLSLAKGRATSHAHDFLLMHPLNRFHRLSDADMKFGARTHLYLPPSNERYIAPTPQQVLTGAEETRNDAFIEYRRLSREAHAWPRHNILNNIFIHILRKSGYSVRASYPIPVGAVRGEADFLVYGLFDNQDVAFDVSVTATDLSSLSTQSAATAGVAADARARQKINKYEATCTRLGMTFRPLVFEDFGCVHSSVHALITHLHGSDSFEATVPEFTTWGARTARDYWYQSLSRGLVAGNAQMYRMARPYWFDTHTGSARARRV